MARSTETRIADAKQLLRAGGSDAWLATASDSVPHVVPLSLAWDDHDQSLLFCTKRRSITAENIGEDGAEVRVILGTSRDVVAVDGTATVLGFVEDCSQGQLFTSQTGWNPATEPGVWVYIRVELRRVQAWRDVAEITGRTIMKNGTWLE